MQCIVSIAVYASTLLSFTLMQAPPLR